MRPPIERRTRARPDRTERRFVRQRFVPSRLFTRTGRTPSAGTAHPGCVRPIGMMNALRIARDLGADHARRVGLLFGPQAADRAAPSRPPRYPAHRPTGNRADKVEVADVDLGVLVHARKVTSISGSRAHLCGARALKPSTSHASGAQISPAIGAWIALPVDVKARTVPHRIARRPRRPRAGPARRKWSAGSGDGRVPGCLWGAACQSGRERHSSR